MDGKSSHVIIAATIALLVGIVGGFFIGKNYGSRIPVANLPGGGSVAEALGGVDESVFDSRTAVVSGKIASVDDSRLDLVTNSGKNVSFEITPQAQYFLITAENTSNPTLSDDFSKLDKDLNVIVNLVYEGGKYKVAAVSSIPTLSAPPQSTSSATTN